MRMIAEMLYKKFLRQRRKDKIFENDTSWIEMSKELRKILQTEQQKELFKNLKI